MMMKKVSAAVLALALSMSTLAALPASAADKEGSATIVEQTANADVDFPDEGKNAPGKPETVSATAVSGGVELKWKKVSGCAGYLLRTENPSNSEDYYWQYLWGENVTSYVWDVYKSSMKNWNYTVAAFNVDGNGKMVLGKAGTFPAVKEESSTTAPDKITFTGYSVTTKSITLNWNKVTADGIEIECKSDTNADWKTLSPIGGSETSVTINKLTPNTTYYVRLRAFKNNGSSKIYGSYSEEKVIKTNSDTTKAPGAVTIKRVAASHDSLNLYWDAIECDGYQLYFNKTGGENDWEFVANVSNKTLNYRFSDLQPEHTYWISIRAYNYDSSSNPVYGVYTKKEAKTTKKGSSEETVETPAKVEINSYSATYDAIRINWKAVKCDGYQLYINETGDSNAWKHVANVSGDTTTYRFTKLKANHQYWFTFRAYNKLSNGEIVGGEYAKNTPIYTKSASNNNVQKPAKTEIVKTSRTSTAIRLNWNYVNCDGYFIYQYDNAKKAWVRKSIIKDAATTTKRFSGLTPDTTYIYKLRAFKYVSGGSKVYGEYSSPRSVTTKKK